MGARRTWYASPATLSTATGTIAGSCRCWEDCAGRKPGLFILGNHDSWFDTNVLRRRFHRLGMHDLGNCWKQLTIRGQPLVAVGYEAPWFKPAPNMKTCPMYFEDQANGSEDKLFRLCLSHGPDSISWARRHNIDLMLAGHVHGGQIRLPLLGSLFVPSRYSRRFDCGTFFEAPTVMHVGARPVGQAFAAAELSARSDASGAASWVSDGHQSPQRGKAANSNIKIRNTKQIRNSKKKIPNGRRTAENAVAGSRYSVAR